MVPSQQKAKIKWHCRRGMLELDLILDRFVNEWIDRLTPNQLQLFEQLLDQSDPDLYAWLMGYDEPKENGLQSMVAFIRTHGTV